MKSDPGDGEVAIIGCGFTGTLQAINLARHGGPAATLIERRPASARGLAYSSLHPRHLLNVRAARMSAFPDAPDHFVHWLGSNHPKFGAEDFVPRSIYGQYLEQLLQEALGQRRPVKLLQDEAVDLAERITPCIHLANGGRIQTDVVMLATGNLPSHVPAGLDAQGLGELYQPSPWDADAFETLSAEDAVLLLGTGLTMIDVLLLLQARGHRGPIVALSRRGLIPHAHGKPHPPASAAKQRPSGSLSVMTREVRTRARAIGWQDAVDELRPVTQAIWRGLDESGKRRFLRHLRPWWDIHRHRIAPQVAAAVEEMKASGQLTVSAGFLRSSVRDGQVATISWIDRKSGETRNHCVKRVINCTGPLGDIRRTSDVLLRGLLERGRIRPDPLNLGIDVDQQSRTIDASGTANSWLYALGPVTRGAFWEIVAVPDIRSQTWHVARRLSDAHWVEGEGL